MGSRANNQPERVVQEGEFLCTLLWSDRQDRHTHLSTKSDYVKAGSGMLLMQLASGFSVGCSTKACMMVCGQLLVGEETP